MRKRGVKILFIAGIALAIIFANGFIIKLYLQKTSDELLSKLDKIDHYVDTNSWDEAYQEINALNKDWERKEKVWGMIINHHEIDNISISLKASLVYINKKDQADSLASLSSLRHYIGHIPVMEKISLKNIF
jgi:hypothetical protein